MRRRRAEKRQVLPDPKYKNVQVAKFINIIMTMFIRRFQSLPILYLLIISVLISPMVTSDYAWCVAADKHSFQKEAVSEGRASDNCVANVTYR